MNPAQPADSSEEAPFKHSGLKHRAIAWVSMNLFDSVTYTIRHGLLKGMKRKGGLGWLPARLSNAVVTKEQRFWSALDFTGMTVYDIGAFHGMLTLHFARTAKTVIAFEPNTKNRNRLAENLSLNNFKNVLVRPVGIGSCTATHRMVGTPLIPGAASIDESAISLLEHSDAPLMEEEIMVVTLDEDIQRSNLPIPDFVKIDIEGLELQAVTGARNTLERYHPTLFLEMHGQTIAEKKRKVAEIVDLLWKIGYRSIRHVETNQMITPDTSEIAKEGHLYCRV
jgi:FkbM family methyltransferase